MDDGVFLKLLRDPWSRAVDIVPVPKPRPTVDGKRVDWLPCYLPLPYRPYPISLKQN